MTDFMEKQAVCVWTRAHIRGIGAWDMCTYSADIDIWVSRRIQQRGSFEGDCVLEVVSALRAAAKAGPEPVLIDVGGNIGMFSLAAAAVGVETHTFEPVPANALKLMASAVRNGFGHLIHLYSMGASDDNSVFAMGVNPQNQGGVTHVPLLEEGAKFMQIPVVPLDSVLPSDAFSKRPVYLKMDIEGGECRALRGMRRFLQKANLIGAAFETDKSETIACCNELMRPPNGAFQLLRFHQSLCPYDQDRRNKLPFEDLCFLKPKNVAPAVGMNATWPDNMIWKPC
uniref:Methyltransferase FkbM domain-containing protein n=1 Tax=Chrysotila carterae TaxID=13221 RepID=A0A7S4F9B9_CHRCT